MAKDDLGKRSKNAWSSHLNKGTEDDGFLKELEDASYFLNDSEKYPNVADFLFNLANGYRETERLKVISNWAETRGIKSSSYSRLDEYERVLSARAGVHVLIAAAHCSVDVATSKVAEWTEVDRRVLRATFEEYDSDGIAPFEHLPAVSYSKKIGPEVLKKIEFCVELGVPAELAMTGFLRDAGAEKALIIEAKAWFSEALMERKSVAP